VAPSQPRARADRLWADGCVVCMNVTKVTPMQTGCDRSAPQAHRRHATGAALVASHDVYD
jgi:hypothetical protein